MSDKIFEGMEGYSGGNSEGLSIKEIALRQFQRCVAHGSMERTRGGVINRVVEGKAVEIGVPDQIQIFINNVRMMRLILAPEIKKRKVFIEPFLKEFEIRIEKASEEVDLFIKEQMATIRLGPIMDQDERKERLQNFKLQIMREARNLADEKEWLAYEYLLETLSMLLSQMNYYEEMGVTGGVPTIKGA